MKYSVPCCCLCEVEFMEFRTMMFIFALKKNSGSFIYRARMLNVTCVLKNSKGIKHHTYVLVLNYILSEHC